MMKHLSLLLLLCPSVLAYDSAEVKTMSQTSTRKHKEVSLKGRRASHCQALWAKEKTLRVGNVCIQPDKTDHNHLIVAYSTQDDWVLEEVQLWIGRNLTDMPMEPLKLTQEEQDKQQQESNETILAAAKEGVKIFDAESKEANPSLSSQTPALDLFPYVKTGLNAKFQGYRHYGFGVKLFDLNYTNCPDTGGTTFYAVAHAKVAVKRNFHVRRRELFEMPSQLVPSQSAWAGTPSPEELLTSLAFAKGNVKAAEMKQKLEAAKANKEENDEEESEKPHWMSFSFTIVCDLVPERPENAPERHHANLIPGDRKSVV